MPLKGINIETHKTPEVYLRTISSELIRESMSHTKSKYMFRREGVNYRVQYIYTFISIYLLIDLWHYLHCLTGYSSFECRFVG